MKIISKIRVHPLFYISALICAITGLFKDFIYITIIILVHEIGHILTSIYYQWKIDRIVILPFGGITIFNEQINRPIKEELLIAISGPLLQVLAFSFIKIPSITIYHYFLLFFNLLPIIPLDGSKIFNLLCNKIFSFNRSFLITIYISVIFILLSIFYSHYNVSFLIVILFLVFKLISELKKYKYIINKFFFERYLYKYKFKKNKIINGYNIKKMKRDYKHTFYIDGMYYTEKEILKRMFDK